MGFQVLSLGELGDWWEFSYRVWAFICLRAGNDSYSPKGLKGSLEDKAWLLELLRPGPGHSLALRIYRILLAA